MTLQLAFVFIHIGLGKRTVTMSDMTQVNSENYILRQMDLSNNNISTLTKLAKANLTHHFAGIERLDLSLNNLQTFPEELFIVS